MSISSGQAISINRPLQNPATGAESDADSGPTAALYVNGALNAAVVTVSHVATGLYNYSVALPALSAGDLCQIIAEATVGSITGRGVIWEDTKEPADAAAETSLSEVSQYVFGDYAVLRSMFDGSSVFMLDAGDSYVSQDLSSFPRLFPLPFGGSAWYTAGTGLGASSFTSAQGAVGWGTMLSGGVSQVYTPGLAWEMKFNGVAGIGWTNADRLIDASMGLWQTGVEALLASAKDWRVDNPTIEFFALLCGTGSDSVEPAGFMRRADVALSSSPLSKTSKMTAKAVGVVTKLAHVDQLAGVTTDKSLQLGMALPDSTAPVNASFMTVVALGVRLSNPSRATFSYHNIGQQSTSVSGSLRWIDPAYVGQTALATLCSAGGYTHLRYHTGLNENGTVAEIAAGLETLINTVRTYVPNLKIILTCPALPDPSYAVILANTDAAMIQVAQAMTGVAYVSVYRLFGDISTPTDLNNNGYLSGAHPTASGRVLFRGAEIGLYQQATAVASQAAIRAAIAASAGDISGAVLSGIGSSSVYVVSPYANGNLVLYQGDAWNSVEGTAVLVTKPPGATWPTDLSDYAITARINKRSANVNVGSSTFDFTTTVVTAVGISQSLRLECLSAATLALAIGEGTRGYDWQVFATKGNVTQTLIAGTCSVKQRLT